MFYTFWAICCCCCFLFRIQNHLFLSSFNELPFWTRCSHGNEFVCKFIVKIEFSFEIPLLFRHIEKPFAAAPIQPVNAFPFPIFASSKIQRNKKLIRKSSKTYKILCNGSEIYSRNEKKKNATRTNSYENITYIHTQQ